MDNYEVSLKVNGNPIELSEFPRDFVARTLAGAATSLKGVNEVDSLALSLKFGKTKLSVNGHAVDLIKFPTLILASTLKGMLGVLSGVEGEISSADVKIMKIRS
jgi:hypothetical protein